MTILRYYYPIKIFSVSQENKLLKIKALIVDPKSESRAFLWQAILENSDFQNAKAVPDIEDALYKLSSDGDFDIILINSALNSKKITDFIPKAKETPGGKEAAYVTVLKSKDHSNENVAMGMIEGTDGFLLEPYTVDSLKKVALLAAKIKGEFEAKRNIAALNLLVQNLIPKLDKLAELHRRRENTKTAKEDLEKTYKMLEKIVVNNYPTYAKSITAEFIKATPRTKRLTPYKGASKILREKYS